MGRRSQGYQLVKYEWSDCWYVTFSEGRRSKRVSTGETDRKEAERFQAQLVLELGRAEREPAHELTVEEALADYLTEHAVHIASKDTAEHYAVLLNQYFPGKTVAALTPATIREFTSDQIKARRKPGTIRRILTILLAALNHARKEGRLAVVPHISMPAQAPPKERFLTVKEARKLLMACKTDHIRLFVALALYTGQRKGAILDLKWEQVNLKEKIIDFNPPGRTQTAKKRVTVPINNDLMGHLRSAKKTARTGGHVISYQRRGRMGDIKKGFKQACEAAGLKNVTPHTLRHTAGTWLAKAGVDMWRISGILGHSHSRTTELYLKHSPDYLRDAMDNLTVAHKLRTKPAKTVKKTAKVRKS